MPNWLLEESEYKNEENCDGFVCYDGPLRLQQ